MRRLVSVLKAYSGRPEHLMVEHSIERALWANGWNRVVPSDDERRLAWKAMLMRRLRESGELTEFVIIDAKHAKD